MACFSGADAAADGLPILGGAAPPTTIPLVTAVGTVVLGLLSITGLGNSWTLLVPDPLGFNRTILIVLWLGCTVFTGPGGAGARVLVTVRARAGLFEAALIVAAGLVPVAAPTPSPVKRAPFPALIAANCSGVTRITRGAPGSFLAGCRAAAAGWTVDPPAGKVVVLMVCG